jgi:glycosyltransferase involved in cell wall biosynthesis
MKVLFYTYQAAFKIPGGGEVQLRKTKEYLEKLGISVKLYEEGKDSISDYDVIHSFSLHSDTLKFLQGAKLEKKPIAISTIFWPLDELVAREKFRLKDKLKIKVKAFIDRHASFLSPTKKLLEVADVLLPNGEAEEEKIIEIFGTDREKFHVVPNGVDERFKNADSAEFEGKYGMKDFVLCVGRFEPRKNQLGLIRALKGENIQIVFIGDAKDQEYLDLCKKEASEKVKFLGFMPHESSLLMSAYAACRVFVLPSWYETPGLTALEAGLAGSNIVITEKGATKEYFEDLALYVNPASPEDIKQKVMQAFKNPKSGLLKKHIMQNFTWKEVAEKTLEAYRKIA